ncbi:unnamed protein product, partial [marine sediment metagenome]
MRKNRDVSINQARESGLDVGSAEALGQFGITAEGISRSTGNFNLDGTAAEVIPPEGLGVRDKTQALARGYEKIDRFVNRTSRLNLDEEFSDVARSVFLAAKTDEQRNSLMFEASSAYGMSPDHILEQGGTVTTLPVTGPVTRRFGVIPIPFTPSPRTFDYDFTKVSPDDWKRVAWTMPINWKAKFPEAETQQEALREYGEKFPANFDAILKRLGVTKSTRKQWLRQQSQFSMRVY